jgi:hypothetical protein
VSIDVTISDRGGALARIDGVNFVNFVGFRGQAAERSEEIAKQCSSSANSLRSARPTTRAAVSIDGTNSVCAGAAVPQDSRGTVNLVNFPLGELQQDH